MASLPVAKCSSSSEVDAGAAPGFEDADPGPRQRRREHEPARHRILDAIRRPAEPPAADAGAVEENRVRPVENQRLHRRRDGADGVGERRHAGEEDPARQGERLLGLEHQGELEDVEPADMDEGAGAGFRRDPAGMGEGVAGLAQGDERVGRRQVERRFRLQGGDGHAAFRWDRRCDPRSRARSSSNSSIEEG